jgi:hypothetical protein
LSACRGRAGSLSRTATLSIAVRFLLAGVGSVAVVIAVYRFRAAAEPADEAERVGNIPKLLRTIFMYKAGALMTGVVGLAFIAIAVLAP